MTNFTFGKFSGQFTFNKEVHGKLFQILISPARRNCHWKLTSNDWAGLAWDGCPYLDEYLEWLKLTFPLIERCKYKLNGTVHYDLYDFIYNTHILGEIKVVDNKIVED